jgi:hypothetical protein
MASMQATKRSSLHAMGLIVRFSHFCGIGSAAGIGPRKGGAAGAITDMLRRALFEVGGGRGIRTPESLSTLTVFKTGAFNRSAIPPSSILPDSIILRGVSQLHLSCLLFPRHNCHVFVTCWQLRHGPRLRLVIQVRVSHSCCDRRMPQEFLHRHKVHPGARQP